MSLETIYVVRHGFRSAWSVDQVGNYTASIPSPTGIAADPALTSHGMKQARELGKHLTTLDPPIDVVFSSPYYRCLQTIDPFVQSQQELQKQGQLSQAAAATTKIRPESGFCEWFGAAPFDHPQPAGADDLKSLVPSYDEDYKTALIPSIKGETYAELRDRVASALAAVIARCDAEGKKTMVLCTHAAVVIVLGRVLTGQFPESMDVEDFRAFTCGLTEYKRDKKTTSTTSTGSADTGYKGVGTWKCEKNSDCSFLSTGEERGWKFAGDESFPGTGSMSQPGVDSKL